MRIIQWGILGLGKIAEKFASDLTNVPNCKLQAVASRNLQKASSFAKKHNSESFYGSYEELYADPTIDVVYIATPNSFHLPHTLQCLHHNKNVLCEKPLGRNKFEVEQMINVAKDNKLFLMEAMWTRFIPATQEIIEIVSSKRIGDIVSIHADFGFTAELNPDGRLYNSELGGGALLDIGIYPIYLSWLLFGEPTFIKAMGNITATNVDSYVAMLFNFSNNTKALLECTIEATTPTVATLYGTKGTLYIHSRFHHPSKLEIVTNDGNKELREIPYTGNGYFHEIEEVNTCIRENKKESELHSLNHSLALSSILDEVKTQLYTPN